MRIPGCSLQRERDAFFDKEIIEKKGDIMNNITITGNLTKDPELRYTPSGIATATLGVAVNRRWQDQTTRQWQEAVSFFDVVLWRDLAENACESLAKGDRVIVTGRLEQQSWQTPEGEKRYRVLVVAEEIGPSLRWAVTRAERVSRVVAAEPTPEVGSVDSDVSDGVVDF
jgi:single-strand DNA-binding protein